MAYMDMRQGVGKWDAKGVQCGAVLWLCEVLWWAGHGWMVVLELYGWLDCGAYLAAGLLGDRLIALVAGLWTVSCSSALSVLTPIQSC